MSTLGQIGVAEQDINMFTGIKVRVSEIKVVYTHSGYILTMLINNGEENTSKTLVTRRNVYKPRLFKKLETLQQFIRKNFPYLKEYKMDISAMTSPKDKPLTKT
jgi:hypothetical protein